MARLIDADELTMQIMSMITDKAILYGNDAIKRSKEIFALAMVAQAPTIDAVPIIRCRDCKYGEMRTQGDTAKHCRKIINEWDYTEPVYLDKDFYCAWAERKETS